MGLKLNGSKQLFNRALSLIPGGVNSPVRAFKHVGGTPLFMKSAAGSSITDVDDNRYVDFCMSWGPLILGHANLKVIEAVEKAAKDGLSYGACHQREVDIADLLLSGFKGFERIRLMSSGTEAVMTALRLARAATGREYIVKFEGGYHGHSDGMLVKAGSGLATQGIASSAGVLADVAKATLVAPFDDEEAVESLFKQYRDRIAALIIEPLPANNGILVQRREFIEFLREITQKFGTLLIFDEVISGFRLHFGGYGQLVGVDPDLVTLGKVIGGGMPIGAVVGKAELMDSLSPLGEVYQAGTLSGNPVSLAAGLATLQTLAAEPIYQKLESLGKHFDSCLAKTGLNYTRSQRVGSIIWLYFDEGELPRRHDTISGRAITRFKKIYWKLLEDGYYLPPSAYEVLFISSAHSLEEIEAFVNRIGRNLKGQPDD